MRLDALDVSIIELLGEDARLSFRELAARLGSTTPTVAARVRAMEDIGLLLGYRAVVHPSAWGGAPHVLWATVRPGEAHEAARALSGMEQVAEVALLPGGRITARLMLRPGDMARLHGRLAALPGLLSYDAFEVLQALEGPKPEQAPQEVDIPCHQCGGPIHGDPVRSRHGGRMHVFCCRHCQATFSTRFETHSARDPRRPSA